MGDCIFCKIVNGDIPSAKVYEDENVYAFLDISQVTKGHTLVIPKVHKENIFELTPDMSAPLFESVKKVADAIHAAFSPKGLNLLNNNGKTAGQTVFHYHMHLIPRYGSEDGFHPVFKENSQSYDLKEVAAAINAQL
ncbi:HIT family protein [Domibacillus epiphyticus]|uniref:HIT family protein n=1 Tax=Domibacillus epiphyticus TaxID=1714355 RepID=A0A1V2A8E5_9BACI|nr:HIT family protein [Domibacillus epiphyticus]OMP67132.1 HIT family protein [Domibacillus epiphyticus]